MKKIIKLVSDRANTYQITDNQALGLLVLLIVVLFSPLLFFGKILLNADATYYAYPIAYFFQHFIGNAVNPFIFSSYPVADAFQIGFFHPIYNLFFYVFNYVTAYHLLLAVNLMSAAVFTYLLARRIGLSIYASLVTSIAYSLSQFSVAWSGVLSVSGAVLLLPATFYAILRIVELRKRFALFLGIVLGLAFLGTHYEFIIMTLLGSGLFFIFEIKSKWDKQLALYQNIKPFLFLVCAFGLALLIGFPQIIHGFLFLKESTRAVILVYFGAPYFDLVRYVLPTFNTPWSLVEFRPYIGIISLLFAVFGLYAVYCKKIEDRRARFFVWLFGVTFLMSLKYFPSIYILKLLPFIKYFNDQSRWMFLANFAVVILAGYGFDFVYSNAEVGMVQVSRFLKKITIGAAVIFSVANILILWGERRVVSLVQSYFDANMYATTTHLPIEHYHEVIRLMLQKLLFNFSFLNPDVGLLLVFLFASFCLVRMHTKKVLFSNLTILFLSMNLILVSLFSLNLTQKTVLDTKSHISEFIHSREPDPHVYRTFSFLIPFVQYQEITASHPEEETESLLFAKEALVGNLNILSEVPIVGGYDPLAFRRYQDLVTFLEDTTAKRSSDEKTALFLNKISLLSVFNVKYIISPYLLNSSGLDLVFSEKITKFNIPLYVYQNKKFIPRVSLVQAVIYLPEDAENVNLKTITEAKSDFTHTTFIECDTCSIQKNTVETGGKLRLLSETNTRIVAEVSSEKNEWLVISNEAVPGWAAKIDSQPTRIYYANHAFQGIQVPPGTHTVEVSYTLIPKLSF
jgi:hypothetical protein